MLENPALVLKIRQL